MSISMASRKGAAGPRLRRPASLRSSGIRRSARRRARSTPRSAGWTTSSRTSTCSWSSAAAWTASSPRQSFRASAGAGGREGRPVHRDTTPRLPAEHDNTGDATVQVLHGRECMHSGGDPLGGAASDLCAFRKRRTASRPLRTRWPSPSPSRAMSTRGCVDRPPDHPAAPPSVSWLRTDPGQGEGPCSTEPGPGTVEGSETPGPGVG